uniref:Uncharacterized protein n=1 Tax=Arion vulgaris TaxID=1028688 RepID=A0A0B6ZNC9_9EUPU
MSAISEPGANSTPKFKMVLLGDSGVGKTSIFLRIRDNEFQCERISTIGTDTCARRLKVDGTDIQVTLWDTAGVERFRTVTRNFYRNAQAILLVFSVDEPSTLLYLSRWEQDAREYAPTAQRFLVGNKIDMDRLVSQETMEHFASSHDCEFVFLTSAKTGQGIADVLKTVAQHLLNFHKKTYENNNLWLECSVHVNQDNPNKQRPDKCC